MGKHRTPRPARRRALTLAGLLAAAPLATVGTAVADDEQTCGSIQLACVDEVAEVGQAGPLVEVGDVGFQFGFGG